MIVTRQELELECRNLSLYAHWKIGDREYYRPTYHHVEEFLQAEWTDKLTYLKEIFDCEDFEVVVLASCRVYVANLVYFGEIDKKDMRAWTMAGIWGFHRRLGHHGWNIVWTSDRGWRQFEPQTDEIKPLISERIYEGRF